MAEITPVTREEFYLAKAGGQDVPVPSAVTRKEYYLEKLSNDSVVVPTPVTRREKFLYFACGGEVNLPSEEKMTRLERLIAKAGGMEISTPTAITRLEKFWANVEGGGWKVVTGTLPLTFRTSETALRSWTIFGNNTPHNYSAEGTLPLTFTTYTTGNASDWEIRGNAQGVGERTENLFDIGKVTDRVSSGHTFLQVINNEIHIDLTASTSTPDGDNHTLRDLAGELELNQSYMLKATSTGNNKFIYLIGTGANFTWAFDYSKTFTTQESLDAALDARILWHASGVNTTAVISNIMLVKDSTAPSTYVPYGYEIPISTQGKNLFDINTMIDPDSDGKYLKNGGTTGNEVGFAYTTYIPIAAQRVRLDNVTGGAASICCYDANKNFIRGQMYYQQSVILLNTSDAAFVRFSLKPATESNAALFGLNDYTFYIGSTPLTEGQSISKTSTGVDIAAMAGSNTITTSLYNKPSMSIEGVDYVGVGEPINDSWQIPLTVSDGTNTATVNVPIEAPLTEGQSVTDTLTINTFEGENTVDTTLTNKPQMTITYKGG